MTYKEALGIAIEYLAKADNCGCFTFRFKRDEARFEEAIRLLYRLEDELCDDAPSEEETGSPDQNKGK